jgi:uncharacterized membrane protein
LRHRARQAQDRVSQLLQLDALLVLMLLELLVLLLLQLLHGQDGAALLAGLCALPLCCVLRGGLLVTKGLALSRALTSGLLLRSEQQQALLLGHHGGLRLQFKQSLPLR